jgi:cysteine synthase
LASRPLPRTVTNIIDLVGNTPMLQLTRIGGGANAGLFAKLEFLNPGLSVKDRIGVGMIVRAERDGLLHKGGTIIEPTAGNTGIGLALAGVRMGYRVILCVPENFSIEKREIMKALGGEVVLTSADGGIKEAIVKAEELQRSIENSYVCQQFRNPYNSESHYETTGPEIWEQMEGEVDGFVAGSGSGGTFTGVARFLKEKNRAIYCAVVEPQGSVLNGGSPGKPAWRPKKESSAAPRPAPTSPRRCRWRPGSVRANASLRSSPTPPSATCRRGSSRSGNKRRPADRRSSFDPAIAPSRNPAFAPYRIESPTPHRESSHGIRH